MKGETLDEITGLAAVLRNKANTISPKVADYVDFVGTGGDCTYSFNYFHNISVRCGSSRASGGKTWQSFHFF